MQKMMRTHLLYAALTLVVLGLTGCAGTAPNARQTTEYVCADGARFQLSTLGDRAEIHINGMHFDLIAESSSGDSTTYSCSMLTLTQTGDRARVEMEGRPYLDRCRSR